MDNILKELEGSLRAHGYVGDPRPAKLVYLTLVSTLLPKPLSLVIKGSAAERIWLAGVLFTNLKAF